MLIEIIMQASKPIRKNDRQGNPCPTFRPKGRNDNQAYLAGAASTVTFSVALMVAFSVVLMVTFSVAFSVTFSVAATSDSAKATPKERAIRREKSTIPLVILLIVYTPFALMDLCERGSAFKLFSIINLYIS